MQKNGILFQFPSSSLPYILILIDLRVVLIVKYKIYFNGFKTFEIQICSNLNELIMERSRLIGQLNSC